YFPPRSISQGRLRDVSKPLYVTEGEKKGLSLDQAGYATVALVGVDNFHDVGFRKQTGEYRLHPKLLEHVTFADRTVVIVFDADARDKKKPGILRAASRLAQAALVAGASDVQLVLPPLVDGGPKGIDDFLYAKGQEATDRLLEDA